MDESTRDGTSRRGGGGSPIRILIADDHPVFREGLRAVLNRPGLAVVGEAATGTEAIAQLSALKPDVILLDIRMPEMDGLQALRAIKALNPRVSVIMLTTYESADYLWSAVIGGAAGYVLKGTDPNALADLIHRVAEGDTALDAAAFQELILRFSKASGLEAGTQPDEEPDFTERERTTLRLMANGMKNLEIARQLGVVESTVKSHINHIFQKIHVSDRTQAVVWVHRHPRQLEPRPEEPPDAPHKGGL